MDQYILIPFYGDEHPFTSYFDVHQGYKVLTHCHVGTTLRDPPGIPTKKPPLQPAHGREGPLYGPPPFARAQSPRRPSRCPHSNLATMHAGIRLFKSPYLHLGKIPCIFYICIHNVGLDITFCSVMQCNAEYVL